jgi:hypothetical protein
MRILRRDYLKALAGFAAVVLATSSCTSNPAPHPPPTRTPSAILAAAPRECPIGLGLLRGDHLPTAKTVETMQGHVPSWLPDGFGVALTVRGGGDQAWATWVDGDCRELTVFYKPQRIPATPGPRVGPWTVTVDAPGACSNYVLGSATCLGYEANAAVGSVVVQAMGLDRSIGDRIVQSIPLQR